MTRSLLLIAGLLLTVFASPAGATDITVCPPLMLCETSLNPWEPACHLADGWNGPGGGNVYDCWTPNYATRTEQLDAVACAINIERNVSEYNAQHCPGSALPFWVTHINLAPPDYTFFRGIEIRLVPDLHLIPPPPPPACEIALTANNSFVNPRWHQINVHSPFGAFLPGNLTLSVTPDTPVKPELILTTPSLNANTYITNLFVPRTGGPWQVTLSLPPTYSGCGIGVEVWPDTTLPEPFLGAKPKRIVDTEQILRYIALHRGNLAYIESQLPLWPVGSQEWKLRDRTRQALLSTIARTQTLAMDPIDANYQSNPPALNVRSLGPKLVASPGITSAMIGTINTWHIKLMTMEANLLRATQWVDKMNGALLAGDNARAVVLAKGADVNLEAAYTAAKAEVALRKTMYTQWTGINQPSPAHCISQADADADEAFMAPTIGAPAAQALAFVIPEECVGAGTWPGSLTSPAMRADLLAEYTVLHNLSVAANLCASVGVC